jgi:exonuclease SbcD
MRILHTADWHLGHTLHEEDRSEEHGHFLAWLLRTLRKEAVDALLLCGDIFDGANPSATAQRMYYGFLAEATRQNPELDVVVVAGNHDSGARLVAPRDLLSSLGVKVVGRLERLPEGGLDLEELLVPLTDASGEVAAWVAAVPFLRPAELPRVDLWNGEDPLVEGVREVYRQVLEVLEAKRQSGQAALAMGHLYMVGGALSDLSERRVLGGNQHALPVDVFPPGLSYVALGHLHKAQRVGGRSAVRYSGSPLPLSFQEEGYRHRVELVELKGNTLVDVCSLEVPRRVEFLRLPEGGAALPEVVLRRLEQLPLASEGPPTEEAPWPFLEVRVRLDKPDPGLRRRLDAVLEDKAVRLLKLTRERTGSGASLGDQVPLQELDELDPVDIFERCYHQKYDGEVPGELRSAFLELLEEGGVEA